MSAIEQGSGREDYSNSLEHSLSHFSAVRQRGTERNLSQLHVTFSGPTQQLQYQQKSFPASALPLDVSGQRALLEQHLPPQSTYHTSSLYLEQSQGAPASAAPYTTGLYAALSPPHDGFLVDNHNSMLKNEDDHDHEDHDPEDREDETGEADGADDSRGSNKRSRTRRPHLQGRFSGRLTTKEDERRLADECKLLGPLLGGVGKRGDKSRLTLAKIVRGIASGDIRRFCEEREAALQLLKQKLSAISPEAAASVPIMPIQLAGGGSMSSGVQMDMMQREVAALQRDNLSLRQELQSRERLLLELQDKGIISGFVPTSLPTVKAEGFALPSSMLMPMQQSSRFFMDVPSFMPPGGQASAGLMGSAAVDLPRIDRASGLRGTDSAAMPSASEHSRASRPVKRTLEQMPAPSGDGLQRRSGTASAFAPAHLAVGLQMAGGGLGQPALVFQHADLQQQLSTLQAQVEQLQSLSQSRNNALLREAERQAQSESMAMEHSQNRSKNNGGQAAAAGLRMNHQGRSGGGSLAHLGHSPFFSQNTGTEGVLQVLGSGGVGENMGHSLSAPTMGGTQSENNYAQQQQQLLGSLQASANGRQMPQLVVASADLGNGGGQGDIIGSGYDQGN